MNREHALAHLPADNGWSGLLASPYANAVGLLVGLLGLIASYFFYRRSKREVSLGAWVNSGTIAAVSNPNFKDVLQIKYKGETVPQATITSVTIWNDGNQLLEKSCLVAKGAIRIELNGEARVLAAWVWVATRDSISASVTANGTSRADVDFDFLDVGDGFVVTILHTGVSSSVTMNGSIKGSPKGVKNYTIASSAAESLEIPINLGMLSLIGSTILRSAHPVISNVLGIILVISIIWAVMSRSGTRKLPRKLSTGMGINAALRLQPITKKLIRLKSWR